MIDSYDLGRRGTNSGTSASQITDAVDLKGHNSAPRIDVGCAIWIDSGSRAGSYSYLSGRPVLATGVATVSPSFSGALANADTYSILFKPLRFDGADGVNNAINQALSNPNLGIRWQKLMVPISLCPDADMRSTATSDWTTGAGSLAKTTGAWPLGQPVLSITVATNDYVENAASIPVEPGESYYVEATVRLGVTTDSWSLYARDVSNSTNLTPSGTYLTTTRRETQILSGIVTMGATTELARVRLVANTGSATAGQLTNIILRKVKATRHTVQDRPLRILHLGKLFATTGELYEQRGELIEIAAEPKQLQDNMWEYVTGSVSGSLWYEEFVMPATLATDSATTSVPVNDVSAVATELLLRPLMQKPEWNGWYLKAAYAAAKVREEYQALQTVRQGQRVFVAGPFV